MIRTHDLNNHNESSWPESQKQDKDWPPISLGAFQMTPSDMKTERPWQIEARITLPKFVLKGSKEQLVFLDIFPEQCLIRGKEFEVWLKSDFPATIVYPPPKGFLKFENQPEDSPGSLDLKQHHYKLVTTISSKDSKEALDKVFEHIDLTTDVLSFQLQHPVRVVQIEVFDISENLRKGDQRETMTCIGPYLGVLKYAGAFFITQERMSARIDPDQIGTDLSEDLRAGLRWFSKGLSAFPIVDKFAFYWIALEILVSHLIPTEKRFFRCNKCGHEIPCCPSCNSSTSQRPNLKQKIKTFVLAQRKTSELFERLWAMRQLFHGRIKLRSSQEIEELPELVIELKAIVVDALKANLGIPESEPPYSPTQGVIGWKEAFLCGHRMVE